jgi:hypothetical protein
MTSSRKRKALKASLKATHTRRKRAAVLAAAFSAAAVAVATLPYFDKIPQHDSILAKVLRESRSVASSPESHFAFRGIFLVLTA